MAKETINPADVIDAAINGGSSNDGASDGESLTPGNEENEEDLNPTGEDNEEGDSDNDQDQEEDDESDDTEELDEEGNPKAKKQNLNKDKRFKKFERQRNEARDAAVKAQKEANTLKKILLAAKDDPELLKKLNISAEDLGSDGDGEGTFIPRDNSEQLREAFKGAPKYQFKKPEEYKSMDDVFEAIFEATVQRLGYAQDKKQNSYDKDLASHSQKFDIARKEFGTDYSNFVDYADKVLKSQAWQDRARKLGPEVIDLIKENYKAGKPTGTKPNSSKISKTPNGGQPTNGGKVSIRDSTFADVAASGFKS